MFDVGSKLFLRTVTFHLVGEVVAREGDWLQLKDAAWVADSGRFSKAIASGELREVEALGDAYVNLTTVTDAFPWQHALPLDTK
jgi:hypothetical protein